MLSVIRIKQIILIETNTKIMSNMGKVKRNHFVYDPFVGTGSILIGAAHYGAYVCGADLDYNLVHSRGTYTKEEHFLKFKKSIHI
jgi:tRNA (guanine10-N2)-methyltransferase